MRAFPLKPRMRWECPLSPLLLSIVFKVLSTVVRQEEDIQGITIGREEVKPSYFEMAWFHFKDFIEAIRILSDLINTAKWQNTKLTIMMMIMIINIFHLY